MKATPRFFSKLLPAVFLFASTSASAPVKFETPCPVSYDAIGLAQTDANLPAIDRLVSLETQLEGVEKSRFASERKIEIAAIRSEYERLADAVLSEKPEALIGFDEAYGSLRNRLSEVSNPTSRGTAAATSSLSYAQLIEQPELLKTGAVYEVPQASGQGGQASLHKVSVKFSQDVLDYFRDDVQRGHRFLRAIQKGYVPGKSGSGIVRITDQHENLVEVKVIGGNEGHQRLIGCRQADGMISILKVYEKHNEGGGGALKKFASLCD